MNAAVLSRSAFAPAFIGTTAIEFDAMLPALAATGFRFELDHGTIVRMAPAHIPHSSTQSDLFELLAPAARAARTGLRANVEVGVIVDFDVVRVPDVVIWDQTGVATSLVPATSVRLIVEVADQSLASDLGIKAADYAAAGIAEYWIVDVTARVVHLLGEPTAEGYGKRSVVPFGVSMRAACLPEAVIFEG